MPPSTRAERRTVRCACSACDGTGSVWSPDVHCYEPCAYCDRGVEDIDPCPRLFALLCGAPSVQDIARRLDCMVRLADRDAGKAERRDEKNVHTTRAQVLADVRDALLNVLGQTCLYRLSKPFREGV